MDEKLLDERYESGPGIHGRRSNRGYTLAEVEAAQRIGYARGSIRHDSLSGVIYWSSGDEPLEELRLTIEDYEDIINDMAIVLAAMEREWD